MEVPLSKDGGLVKKTQKRQRLGSTDADPLMDFDFMDPMPGENQFSGLENFGLDVAMPSPKPDPHTDNQMTMTTPDHCLVMAQRLDKMAAAGDCCDMQLVLVNSPERPLTLHSSYACAASPILRNLVYNVRKGAPLKTRAKVLRGGVLESRSPSSQSMSGDNTDAYESSTCSSKDTDDPKDKMRIEIVKTEKGETRLAVILPSSLNLDYAALTVVRTYIYTGIFQCSRREIFDVLSAAVLLELQAMVNLATDYIQQNLLKEDPFDVLKTATKHNLVALEDTALSFINENFDSITCHPVWKTLPNTVVEKILRSDHVQTLNELKVFEALGAWTLYDKEKRFHWFLKLAQDHECLRLGNMARDELIEMSQHILVAASKDLRKTLYNEALKRVENVSGAGVKREREVTLPRRYASSTDSMTSPAGLQLEPLTAERCVHTIENCHERAVCALAYVGPNHIVSASGDFKVRVFNLQNYQCERVLGGHTAPIVAMEAFQGKLITASPDRTIRIWSTDNWNSIAVLETPKSSVCSLVVFEEMDKLITGSDDGCLKSWGIGGWSLQRTAAAHQHVIWSLAKYGSNTLVSGSSDKLIKVWTVSHSGFNLVTSLNGHRDEVQALTIDREKNWLISGSDNGTIMIHDCETWTCLRNLVGSGNRAVLSVLSYGNRIIAGLGNGAVDIWDRDEILNKDEFQLELLGHKSCVMDLLVVDGKLVTASYDRTIKVWGN